MIVQCLAQYVDEGGERVSHGTIVPPPASPYLIVFAVQLVKIFAAVMRVSMTTYPSRTATRSQEITRRADR